MHSSKSKSGLSDAANNKDIAAGKNGRLRPAKMEGDSPSLQKNPSFSINGSPNSADSKPAVSRRSTKSSATPDKYSRLLKGSESQAQLASAQEGLRKANEKLFFEEIKEAKVLEELSRAKKAVEEVNKKLGEALLALKKAEENSKLDEFGADEKWQKEREGITNQHAVEIWITGEDSEKSKKAMGGLASALHEEAMEAMDLQERLLIKQAEVETITGELDKLEVALKITQETYEVMLDEAKYEIVCLKKAIEKSEAEAEDLRAEWDAKEINLRTAIEKADEEIASIRVERDRAMEKLAGKKFHAKAAMEEANKLHHKIIEASGGIEKEKAAPLLFREKALQRIAQESDELSESLAKLIGHSVQNGRISVSKHQLLQKRKKALLNKFGDLLRKKSASK